MLLDYLNILGVKFLKDIDILWIGNFVLFFLGGNNSINKWMLVNKYWRIRVRKLVLMYECNKYIKSNYCVGFFKIMWFLKKIFVLIDMKMFEF